MNGYLVTHRILNQIKFIIFILHNIIINMILCVIYITQAPFTMPSSCTAYKCSNRSDQGYALVRYPHDEVLKRKWIAAVERGKNWSPSSSQRLCEVSNNMQYVLILYFRR